MTGKQTLRCRSWSSSVTQTSFTSKNASTIPLVTMASFWSLNTAISGHWRAKLMLEKMKTATINSADPFQKYSLKCVWSMHPKRCSTSTTRVIFTEILSQQIFSSAKVAEAKDRPTAAWSEILDAVGDLPHPKKSLRARLGLSSSIVQN